MGYSVIFMHRKHSLQPFARHFQITSLPAGTASEKSGWLDRFVIETDASGEQRVMLDQKSKEHSKLLTLLPKLEIIKKERRLFLLEFQEVHEYLRMLRDVSGLMGKIMGAHAMWYLAAAVSDFYIPEEQLVYR